ncbi:hypothetical protein [Variovorax rhizosphaerae]|uniref:Helix-turn-helix domain-containing protein n=1 Tax=Variovorax rhizosphaerae TaxID=1836200 RepID=A0ABU8WSF1_9BURK
MKKPPDPRGGHSRLYWEIQDSAAWAALAYSSQSLYLALRRKLLSTNNGNIEATTSTLPRFKSPSTLANGLRELQAVGLIQKTRQGGIAMGRRHCNLFRFTDEQVFEQSKLQIPRMPPTNEWQEFKTKADAKRAIATADAAVLGIRKGASKNKAGIRNSYRTDTDFVVLNGLSDTNSVVVSPPLQRNPYTAARQKKPGKPHEH